MPTIAVFTGFEFGTAVGAGAGPFDGTTGTVGTDFDVVADAAVVGTYSGRVLTLNNKGYFWNTTSLGAGKTALVVSRRFKFTTLPTAANDFTSIDVAASSDRAGFYYDPADQKVHAWITSATQASSFTIVANTWYTLQFRYDCSAAINTFDWTLNGTAQTQVTNNLGASTIARYELGNRGGTGGGVIEFDDVVVSVTAADYPLPMYQVRMVGVDTGGTTTEIGTANATVRFTANGTLDGSHNSAAILTALSEVPPLLGATSSGVAQQTAGAGNAVEIPMATYTLTGGETITATRLYLAGWAASALAANLGMRAWNGTAETTLHGDTVATGFDSTTNGAWYTFMYAGVTDQTTLNALTIRMGYSTDVSPVIGAHAVYAEILIQPGAGGVTLADLAGSSGARPGTTTETTATVLNDAAGGGARPGTATETTLVALRDAQTGGARPGTTTETTATVLNDLGPSGARPGATIETTATVLVDGAAGGTRPGATAPETTAVVLIDGAQAGARPGTTVETFTTASAPVTLADAAGGGARPGATIETLVAETEVNDSMVMPVMLAALACLEMKAPLTTSPPQIYRFSSGSAFFASADGAQDECCAGIGWVRFVTMYPTDNFPQQKVDVVSGVETEFAVQLEIGIMRCLPTTGDDGIYGSMVTPAQWQAVAQQEMNDFMTLRKAACCVRDTFVSPGTGMVLGPRGLLIGNQQPIESSGPCGGVSILVTVRVPSCDCT